MTMNLRQRINHELENFHSGVEYHVISPEQFTMALDAYTDRILTEVRESLLSDEALQAVIDDIAIGDRSLREAMEDRRRRGWTPYSTGAYGTARSYVTAALDAVTTD